MDMAMFQQTLFTKAVSELSELSLPIPARRYQPPIWSFFMTESKEMNVLRNEDF